MMTSSFRFSLLDLKVVPVPRACQPAAWGP